MSQLIYYKPEELAEILRVTPEAIRKRLRGGEIQGMRFGRSWRIPREEAERVVGGKSAMSALDNLRREREAGHR